MIEERASAKCSTTPDDAFWNAVESGSPCESCGQKQCEYAPLWGLSPWDIRHLVTGQITPLVIDEAALVCSARACTKRIGDDEDIIDTLGVSLMAIAVEHAAFEVANDIVLRETDSIAARHDLLCECIHCSPPYEETAALAEAMLRSGWTPLNDPLIKKYIAASCPTCFEKLPERRGESSMRPGSIAEKMEQMAWPLDFSDRP